MQKIRVKLNAEPLHVNVNSSIEKSPDVLYDTSGYFFSIVQQFRI